MDWLPAAVALAPAFCAAAGLGRAPGRAAFVFALVAAGSAAAWIVRPGLVTELAGAWCVFGGALAVFAVRRGATEFDAQSAELSAVRGRREALAKELAGLKARGLVTEREHKETLALYGMIKALGGAMKWSDVKPTLEAAVDQCLGVSDYALFTADPHSKGSFRFLTSRRLEGSPGSSWATLGRCLQERGLAVGEPHRIDVPEPAVAVPIQDNGEILGYFYARDLEHGDLAALFAKTKAFASEIAFAFRRIKLFQEVESLSQIDGLTGVYRRGDFDARLAREAVRAKTFKTTFGLMLLDIDHFKQLNDRYGHPFGDQVLKRVGELLNASVYDTDFVARYGGEEFVVLLPRAEPAGAERKAEAIRRAVEAEKFQLGFETVRVTVSIGIAHFPRDAGSPDEIVAQADAAMYEAKSRGRNRVVDCLAMRENP